MTAAMLLLHDVTCDLVGARGHVRALDRVSLAVEPGELVAVMGPSGSGKSTMVHVATGAIRPTWGSVRIEGEEPPSGRPARDWWAAHRRRTLGVVDQRLNLVPGLPVLDNVALPLLLDGERRGTAHDLAGLALDTTGVGHLARALPEELSFGEQQRVAIARAVVGPRRLVLADEPTASLDTVNAEAITELLARLAGAGKAVLFTTHDSRLASWADRVVMLRDGRVGPPARPVALEASP